MASPRRINFEFRNHIAPHYVEPLLLRIEVDQWYTWAELQELLWSAGLDVQGKNIVLANMSNWEKVGIGEVVREGRQNLFRLTPLGIQVRELYSTNQALFFDLMHFFFYSVWRRFRELNHAPFWLYAEICDHLWHAAPGKMETKLLTHTMQAKSRKAFP